MARYVADHNAHGSASSQDEAATPAHRVEDDVDCRVYDDSIVLSNRNTTIGYARFSRDSRTMEYIFVNPAFRRNGYGRLLLERCEKECGGRLSPAPPISPLGRKFSRAVGWHV